MKIDYNNALYIIAFDLDTKLLSLTFGEKNYRKVYGILKKMFSHYNFDHRQRSVYVTKNPESYKNIIQITTFLTLEAPLIGRAIKVMDLGVYFPGLGYAEQVADMSERVIKDEVTPLELAKEIGELFSFLEEFDAEENELQNDKKVEKGDFTIDEK